MQALSPTIVGLQGAFGILNGAASLVFREAAERNVKVLDVQSVPAIHAIAAGSISIGAFYLNAALQNDRRIMWWCVVGRVAAIPVFVQHGGPWINVAIFEGICGVLIAGALAWDGWRGSGEEKE